MRMAWWFCRSCQIWTHSLGALLLGWMAPHCIDCVPGLSDLIHAPTRHMECLATHPWLIVSGNNHPCLWLSDHQQILHSHPKQIVMYRTIRFVPHEWEHSMIVPMALLWFIHPMSRSSSLMMYVLWPILELWCYHSLQLPCNASQNTNRAFKPWVGLKNKWNASWEKFHCL